MVWLAKLISVVSFVSVAIISILIMIFRFRLVIEQKRMASLNAVWQPILVDCLDTVPTEFPPLDARDIKSFLVLWNYFQETLRDAGKENLNAIARRLLLHEWSEHSLSRGSIRERLLAIQTLGWLKAENCWEQLEEIMRTADPVTSLCAAKALVRIDAIRGVDVFMPMVATTPDWSYSTVGKLMRETGAEIITGPLIEAIDHHEGPELVRLLRFIRIAYEEKSAPVLTRLLVESEDLEVLLSCLRATDDPKDLPKIRVLLKSEDWRLRTQAAICLGRLGTGEDIASLVHSSGDQEWWVRLRSASALASLPEVTNKTLKSIADSHDNPFASDVINMIRMEQEAFD